MKPIFSYFLLSAFSSLPILAQTPASPAPISPLMEGYLTRSEAMISVDNAAGAADQLQRIFTEDLPLDREQMQKALYILGTAYSRDGNPRCLGMLNEFISLYPSSPLAAEARLAKADFLFFAHKWPEALEAFNDIDLNRLDAADRARASYRKAFCLTKNGFFDEARPLLASLRSNKEYSIPALFCEAYADYMTQKYTDAYEKFKKVATATSGSYETSSRKASGKASGKANRRYNYTPDGLEAGYYLAQMEYMRQDYDKAIVYAENVLQRQPVEELIPETLRVLGLSYFKLGDKSRARTYLDEYEAATGSEASSDALYTLASLLYDEGDTERAAHIFSRLTEEEDAIGQGAYLFLGQIAAADGDENAAAISFEKASRLTFDRNVRRVAIYNYATARSRGGKTPFRPQIDLLEQFLEEFPDSRQTPQVREYLASAYYHEKDYRLALENLEKLPNPGKAQRASMQKALYQLGIQQLQNNQSAEAARSLQRAVDMGNLNKGLVAQASLWLGDAYYAEGQYSRAEKAYTKALADASALGSNRPLATYGLAYALSMQDKHSQAEKYFRQSASDSALPDRLRSDARLRLADCLFYTGRNADAASIYSELSKVQDASGSGDYAAWRHAVIRGVGGDNAGKIAELSALASKASARWMPEILNDLGDAYSAAGNDEMASSTFSRLLKEFPSAGSAPRAAVARAKSLAKSGRDEEAEQQYRLIISQWPSSAEAVEADGELRKIYADAGRLDEYAAFLRSVPTPIRLDAAEVENLTFEAAADAFNEDEADIDRVEQYIAKYPSGSHIGEALSMAARGYLSRNENEKSLQTYRTMLKSAPEFTSEAETGIMRLSSDPAERLKYARKVAESSGVSPSDREEALFIEAESLASSNPQEAKKIWSQLAANPQSLPGAKSAVALGETLLKEKKYKDGEKALTTFIDSGTPHSYWLARGYIALADIYKTQGKNYLSRQYLESLRDNYPGNEKDIKNMISSRLKNL